MYIEPSKLYHSFWWSLESVKNLQLFFKLFYCTLVFEAIRSSKNMLNMYFKSKLAYYIIFEFCPIISLQGCWNNIDCNTFFECNQYIFAALFFYYRTIHSYLTKLYTFIKTDLNPFGITCEDRVKHIFRTVIIEANTSSVFLFLLLSLIKMTHLTIV